jgi:hypothetical protein
VLEGGAGNDVLRGVQGATEWTAARATMCCSGWAAMTVSAATMSCALTDRRAFGGQGDDDPLAARAQ